MARKSSSEPRVFTIREENRFKLDPGFVAQYVDKQPVWGYGVLSYLTYKRTYARRVERAQVFNESRDYRNMSVLEADTFAGSKKEWSEEYWQTCLRIVEGVSSVIKQQVVDTHQPWSDGEEQHHAQEMFKLMWAFKFTPPGRGLWFMGTEAMELKGGGALNNCGYTSTEHIDIDFSGPFCDLMDYLMLGVGMGFDCEGSGKLTLREPVTCLTSHEVPDTREGWVEAVRRVLNAFVGKGTLPREFDYSKIRKEGTPLKTFGGTASGYGPLKQLLDTLTTICHQYVGKTIDAAFIVDVNNIIGKCVVAGNVRRSSEIALGSPDDRQFVSLKDPTEQRLIWDKQAKIATADPQWMVLQLKARKLREKRTKDKVDVLSEAFATVQTKIDKLEAKQKARLAEIPEWVELDMKLNALPTMSHRWASNNSVVCHEGQDYRPLAAQTVSNGEPGYVWLDLMRKYGRLADAPNFKDKLAKGTNPCVPAGTQILTREGYIAIEATVGRDVDVWNGQAWSRVTPRVTGYDQPLVQVQLSDGTSLTCTDYHEWLLAPRNGSSKEERIRARDLRHGDALSKYDMPLVEGGATWDLAYTHGFFCGDGQGEKTGKGALLYGVKKNLIPYLQGNTTGEEDAYERIYVGFPSALPEKFEVPLDLDVPSRLSWFAGLLDADGAVLQNPNSVCVQLTSVKKDFLLKVRRMLTTLGVQAKVTPGHPAGMRTMPDGKGGTAEYMCQESFRLLVNASDTHRLVSLGLRTHRLDLPLKKPQRDARRFVTVESVAAVGVADVVYCFDEKDTHRGTFEGIVTGQCAEQTLFDKELCCLVETYPTHHDTLDEFLHTLKYAYRYAKAITLIPTHNPATNAVMVKNRRIGTSMAGIIEMYSKLGMKECIRWWDTGFKEILKWDEEYSNWMGVNTSIKHTSIKPGGTTPLVAGVEGGMKAPSSPYYMRTVRFDHMSPLVEQLRKAGYRVEKDRTTPRTMVVYFPVACKEGVLMADQLTLWQQALIFTNLQRYWADNMVSATLTFQSSEADDVARVLEAYDGQWKGVSFLALDTHGYLQAPYIPCTKEQFEEASSRLQPIEGLSIEHDTDDKWCQGGVCEVPAKTG